ncbi:MAG: peptidoglycan-binding domain-containing protein, partial [bacterium]|nr:peptidoglycan-binding domain-containing protein [bacterium]
DSKLDVNETWVYSCTKNLTQTTTNIVTATGQANGITAVDTANATVVVGVPGLPDTGIVPPLIHVVKVPNVFVLPAGGGPVTYKYVVSNPGTVPLSNVSITDDKCTGLPGRVLGHSGDINQNNLLESNEAWSFTCKTSLTQTTINIGTAEGSANGMTAVDFSPATVVVAPLKLPNMGTTSGTSGTLTIGVEGDDVVTLQKTLEKKGFLVMPAGSAYGFFGSLTSIAVAKYQKSAGLPANGVFDLKTRAMLYADAANNIALPDAGTETNALIDTINKSGEVSAGIFVIFILIFLLILVVYKIIRQRGEN